jgi:hypothetical protein
MTGIRRQSGWLIGCGMLLTSYSMALEPPADVIEAAGTKPAKLCGRSLLLHASSTNPRWRSNVQFCPHFLDTMGFPLSSTLKRT